MTHLLYSSFSLTGADRLLWSLGQPRLRILCYHGICEDRLAGEPWMPHFFVKQSVFDQQLRYLSRNARVLPLSEAAARLHAGTLPPRSVCLTFDDGYANNLHLAYPLLQRYETPATIFVSTSYVESGDFFPFLKLKLVPSNPARPPYKSSPLDSVMQTVEPAWNDVRLRLTRDQQSALRALTVEETRAFDPLLVELGAHGHTHCILGNETASRRENEIRTSIRRIAGWIGRPVRLFSYPNGQAGDFNEADKGILRTEGIKAAVAGMAGANTSHADPFALRRYPLGLFHDGEGRFSAEVTGFRTALRSLSRSSSQ